MTTPATTSADSLPTLDEKLSKYENNPFNLGVTGLELLFNKAKQLGIVLAVLTLLGFSSNLFFSFPFNLGGANSHDTTSTVDQDKADFDGFVNKLQQVPLEIWLLLAMFLLILALIAVTIAFIVAGAVSYSAARLAKNKPVTLSEAISASLKNFWGYSWMSLIIVVKVFLWSLLFIIPGVIMAIRYSLSGIAYFDKGLKGNAASKYSAKLTKGGWLTTYAALTLLPTITFGILRNMNTPGATAILYRQFSVLEKAEKPKPSAHWLSWVAFFLPLIFFVVVGLGIILVIIALSLAFSRGSSGLAF